MGALPGLTSTLATGSAVERSTMRRVRWRLLPLLLVPYVVAWIDRVNVGFASLQMNEALGFSSSVYGFGAGLFFVGYACFEVPSNLILYRVGVRTWIARIMITWGLLSAATIFVQGPLSFYAVRFFLGVAEAGFFPGIAYYLQQWFPSTHRGKALGWFMMAIPLSNVVGGPSAGLLLGMDGYLGLPGWQWMFLGQGLPAVVLGIVVLIFLPEDPAHARWLRPDSRAWLVATLARERAHAERRHNYNLRAALTHPIVWRLGLVYFLGSFGTYGLTLWLPTIIKGVSGLGNVAIGFISAIPYIAASVATVANGVHSDRTNERVLHVAVPCLVASAAFLASAFITSPLLALAVITVAAMGILARNAPFWALPSMFLSGQAAAGGLALINTVGALGGFVGPYVVGFVRDATGSFSGGLIALSLAVLGSAVLLWPLRHHQILRPAVTPALPES